MELIVHVKELNNNDQTAVNDLQCCACSTIYVCYGYIMTYHIYDFPGYKHIVICEDCFKRCNGRIKFIFPDYK